MTTLTALTEQDRVRAVTGVITDLSDRVRRATEAEIRQSIVNPGAVIAPGYPNAMPSDYGTKISPEELNQLIDFLVTSAAADGQS